MDAIKKKMVKLTTETDEATRRADKFDAVAVKEASNADRIEEELKHITKKFGAKESQYDVINEDLFNATIQLEEKEKVASSAEQDVNSLSRRILLMEDEADKRENRLATAISDLLRASIRADEQIKMKNHIEQEISTNEEDIDGIESQLKDAKIILADSERKYDDIYRKHVNLESECARATERAELEEKKIAELEEELKIVGQNLQQLEVSEERAIAREEAYQKQIRDLMKRLKEAENMAENSEMNIQRLNIRIDQIEDDTLYEKLKIKAISDDLDGTFTQMAQM